MLVLQSCMGGNVNLIECHSDNLNQRFQEDSVLADIIILAPSSWNVRPESTRLLEGDGAHSVVLASSFENARPDCIRLLGAGGRQEYIVILASSSWSTPPDSIRCCIGGWRRAGKKKSSQSRVLGLEARVGSHINIVRHDLSILT